MKTFRVLLSIGLTVGAMATGFQARAGCFGVHLCIPFFSFGVGFGVGGVCAAPLYPCAAPVYGCAQPAFCGYDCSGPLGDPPARQVSLAAPQPSPAPVWVPRTPGEGHWVPDPEPYHYSPAPTVEKKAPSVTVSKAAGGVPVFSISQQR